MKAIILLNIGIVLSQYFQGSFFMFVLLCNIFFMYKSAFKYMSKGNRSWKIFFISKNCRNWHAYCCCWIAREKFLEQKNTQNQEANNGMWGLNYTIWLFRITETFLSFLGRCVCSKRRNIKISVKEYKRYTAETLLVQDQELQLNRFLNLYTFCLFCLFYPVSSGL